MEPEQPSPDAPVELQQPATPPAAEESVADHAAAFHPHRDKLQPAPGADEGQGDRDASGRFRPRHRAKSQEATPDDVGTISALTQRIKDAETAAGADIVQQAGESNRVFELRRRAELSERRREATRPAAQSPQPVIAAQPQQPPPQQAGLPPKPKVDDFQTYEDYLDARDAWNRQAWEVDRQNREAERVVLDSWKGKVDEALKAYPDFEEVALKPATKILQGSLMDAFILQSTNGAHVLYALQRDDAERERIAALSPVMQVEALTLLGQRGASSSRPPAVATGSAAAPASPPVPRPPNPVRTGPMRTGDEPPGDDASVLEHARFYGPKRLR